ncbi:MAG: nitroreductase [Pseudomonadota bacterium]
MKVSDALATRITCRAFTDEPVPLATVRRLLNLARMAPSGGNLQPWHVHVLTGDALADLKSAVNEAMKTTPMGLPPHYEIYPPKLKDPYNARRRKCGEDMYRTIGVTRDDKPGRYAQFQRNFELFGAPVALFVYLDRTMGPPQWSDVGMFLQSLMLAAREEGLHTAPQEAWAMWADLVGEHVAPDPDHMLFCGVGLGHMDESAPINALRTDRAEVEAFATFRGFA